MQVFQSAQGQHAIALRLVGGRAHPPVDGILQRIGYQFDETFALRAISQTVDREITTAARLGEVVAKCDTRDDAGAPV